MKRVVLDKKSLKKYVRTAKKAFPRETYAFFLGQETETEKKVTEVYMPPDQDKFCTPDYVLRGPEQIKACKNYAKSQGLSVLGDVHSHCYEGQEAQFCDHSLSEADILYSDFVRTVFKCQEPIVGLLLLRKPRVRISASIILYPEIQPYPVKIK